MNNYALKDRTKKFAVEVIKLSSQLPNKQVGWVISKQIIRSSTSVAANYRAVNRAKSDRDFISKMGTVIEESDDTLFWLELIKDLDLGVEQAQLDKLINEANQLTAIFVSSIKTFKARLNKSS